MKIAIITGSARPIPATRGGATQTMMTHLIDVNEQQKKNDFIIYSYFDVEAEMISHQYQHSEFRYYHAHNTFDLLCGLPYRLLRKASRGRTYMKTNFIRWCIKRIKEDKPDVIVIEGNYFQTLQLKNALNIPLILHMHIDGLHTGTDHGKNIVSACKGIFVISDYCRKRVAQIDPAQATKVHVLKNAIDVDHFNTDGRMAFRRKYRAEHGIGEDAAVIAYCGRLDENKGVKEALEAFSMLEAKNTYMYIIGSSAYRDGKKNAYVRELEKLAGSLDNRVIFTGYISQEELPNYYAVADISVVPSKCQEAAGNVIIEAMACKLPVVTTKQGGIPEYADPSCCILVDCDEKLPVHLKEALATLIDNKELYQNMQKSARQVALQYDKVHYYENFVALISKVLEG